MKAQTGFVELKSIPRTLLFDFTNDYAKKQYGIERKRWCFNIELGLEFTKRYFTGLQLSYDKSFFDYPAFYYTNHKLSEFWQQSYTSGIFMKKRFLFRKKSENENQTNCLVVGTYLFYTISKIHQLISVPMYPYGIYDIPININEKKFSYSFQIAGWIKLYKNFFFEPAIQIGYYKENPNLTIGTQDYISGQGSVYNNISQNFTLSFIYFY